MKPCPKCSCLCPQDNKFCPNCKALFSKSDSTRGKNSFIGSVIVVGGLAFGYFVFLNAPRQQAQQKALKPSFEVIAKTPQQIVEGLTKSQINSPQRIPISSNDGSWMWNEQGNKQEIKNAFAKAILGQENSKAKDILRSLYSKFTKVSASKNGLRDLYSDTLVAESEIKNLKLQPHHEDPLLMYLGDARKAINERVSNFGLPSKNRSVVEEVPMPPEPVDVEYQIIAGTRMKWSATYENEQGGTEQITDGVGSWKKKMQVPRGSYLYLSAQNGEKFGGIFVYITVNGEQVKRSEGSGGYCIASASYTVQDK